MIQYAWYMYVLWYNIFHYLLQYQLWYNYIHVYVFRIYKRYYELKPGNVPVNMSEGGASSFKLPHREVERMAEFKV